MCAKRNLIANNPRRHRRQIQEIGELVYDLVMDNQIVVVLRAQLPDGERHPTGNAAVTIIVKEARWNIIARA